MIKTAWYWLVYLGYKIFTNRVFSLTLSHQFEPGTELVMAGLDPKVKLLVRKQQGLSSYMYGVITKQNKNSINNLELSN